MKVAISATFAPVTVTFETQEELDFFYAILNCTFTGDIAPRSMANAAILSDIPRSAGYNAFHEQISKINK